MALPLLDRKVAESTFSGCVVEERNVYKKNCEKSNYSESWIRVKIYNLENENIASFYWRDQNDGYFPCEKWQTNCHNDFEKKIIKLAKEYAFTNESE